MVMLLYASQRFHSPLGSCTETKWIFTLTISLFVYHHADTLHIYCFPVLLSITLPHQEGLSLLMVVMKEPNEFQQKKGATVESFTEIAHLLINSEATDLNVQEPVRVY